MRIVWTKPALQHLVEIGDHIAQHNVSAASRVLLKIEESVAPLSHFPKLGRAGREGASREIAIPGMPYIVSYRLHDDRIEILAVIHGARDWPRSGS